MKPRTILTLVIAIALFLVGMNSAFAGGNKKGNPFKHLKRQINALVERVDALQNTVAFLGDEKLRLEGDIGELQQANSMLEAKLSCVSDSSNSFDVIFDGCNVRIVNGMGQTDTTNGFGNLVVGYDEARASGSDKSGSHNLVVGPEHNYSSYGGFVAGKQNTISGFYASVSGGEFNTASRQSSSVSGGFSNTASSGWSSVSGGFSNVASGTASSVSGGRDNTASSAESSVSGGEFNTASSAQASVSGGLNRTASGRHDWRAGNLFQEN